MEALVEFVFVAAGGVPLIEPDFLLEMVHLVPQAQDPVEV
jgi:hypothetical protein